MMKNVPKIGIKAKKDLLKKLHRIVASQFALTQESKRKVMIYGHTQEISRDAPLTMFVGKATEQEFSVAVIAKFLETENNTVTWLQEKYTKMIGTKDFARKLGLVNNGIKIAEFHERHTELHAGKEKVKI